MAIPIPFHRFEMIDMQGQSLGQWNLYPGFYLYGRYQAMNRQGQAQEMMEDQNTFIPDTFTSMLYDSNAYRRDFIYFVPICRNDFSKTSSTQNAALFILHPIYGVVNAIIALAKLIFHTVVLTYRSIQLCKKADFIAEKKYLRANLPLNHTNINFLKNRLSYLVHRDEAVGNLMILGRGIVLAIPFIGLILQYFISGKLQELRFKHLRPSFIKCFEYNEGVISTPSRDEGVFIYRSPTEKTLLIEKLAECENFEEIDEAIQSGLNDDSDPNEPRDLDSYNKMDEGLIGLIHDYAKSRLKKEYWQHEVCREGEGNYHYSI